MVFRHHRNVRHAALLHAAAWLLLLLLGSAERVSAAPSAAERDTARSLMDEGDRMLTSGKLREAMERYRAAHAIMHVPTTGVELARVQARLGLLVEARATAMEVVNLQRAEADEPTVYQRKQLREHGLRARRRALSCDHRAIHEGARTAHGIEWAVGRAWSRVRGSRAGRRVDVRVSCLGGGPHRTIAFASTSAADTHRLGRRMAQHVGLAVVSLAASAVTYCCFVA